MALNANAIASLDQVREELKMKSQAAEGPLERRVNALSRTFEEQTGLVIVERTLAAFRVDGSGWNSLRIPQLPVQSVTKVDPRWEFDDSAYVAPMTNASAWLLKDLDEYGHSHTGYLKLLLVSAATAVIFPYGKGNILLDMKIGYAKTHPVRSEIERLFFMQLAYDFKRWDQNEAGILSRSLSDGSVTFASSTNLLKEVTDGLEALRMRRLLVSDI